MFNFISFIFVHHNADHISLIYMHMHPNPTTCKRTSLFEPKQPSDPQLLIGRILLPQYQTTPKSLLLSDKSTSELTCNLLDDWSAPPTPMFTWGAAQPLQMSSSHCDNKTLTHRWGSFRWGTHTPLVIGCRV